MSKDFAAIYHMARFLFGVWFGGCGVVVVVVGDGAELSPLQVLRGVSEWVCVASWGGRSLRAIATSLREETGSPSNDRSSQFSPRSSPSRRCISPLEESYSNVRTS